MKGKKKIEVYIYNFQLHPYTSKILPFVIIQRKLKYFFIVKKYIKISVWGS